ncbi:hypothetical protein ACHAXS_009371 [Conticribra weissflogii]
MITIQNFENGNEDIEVVAAYEKTYSEGYPLFLPGVLLEHKATTFKISKQSIEEKEILPLLRDENSSPICIGEFPENNSSDVMAQNGSINTDNEMDNKYSNELDDIENFREEMDPDSSVANVNSNISEASTITRFRVSLPRPRQRLPTIFEVVSISIDSGEFSLIDDGTSEPAVYPPVLKASVQEPTTTSISKDDIAESYRENMVGRKTYLLTPNESDRKFLDFEDPEVNPLLNHMKNIDSSSKNGKIFLVDTMENVVADEMKLSSFDMELSSYSKSDYEGDDDINERFSGASTDVEISYLQANENTIASGSSEVEPCDQDKHQNDSLLDHKGIEQGGAICNLRGSMFGKKSTEECCYEGDYVSQLEIDDGLSQSGIGVQDPVRPTDVNESIIYSSKLKDNECSFQQDDNVEDDIVCESAEFESIDNHSFKFQGKIEIDEKLSQDCVEVRDVLTAQTNESAIKVISPCKHPPYQDAKNEESSNYNFERCSKDDIELQDMIPLISIYESSHGAEGSGASPTFEGGNDENAAGLVEGKEFPIAASQGAIARANPNDKYEKGTLEKQLARTQDCTNEISALRRQLKLEQRAFALQNSQLQADIDLLTHTRMKLQTSQAEVIRENMELERMIEKHKKQMAVLNVEKEKLHDKMETIANEVSDVKEIARKLLSDFHQQKKNAQKQMQIEINAVKTEMETMTRNHEKETAAILKEKEELRQALEKENRAIEESRASMKATLDSLRQDRRKMEQCLQYEIDSAKLSMQERKADFKEELNRAKFSETLHKMEALKGHWKHAMKCIKLDAIENAGEFSKVTFQAIMEPFHDDALIKTASVKK